MSIEGAIRAADHVVGQLEVGDQNPCVEGNHHLRANQTKTPNQETEFGGFIIFSRSFSPSIAAAIECKRKQDSNFLQLP